MDEASSSILITGVRGKTGVPLAELLAAQPGVEVRGGSSDPAQVSLPGVRPVRFSWDDPSGWADAVAGVDAVYVVRPDIWPAPELIARLMDALPAHVRVTLLSERRADLFVPDHWARRAELAVTSSARPWAVLRPSWFMQVFTDPRFYADDLAAGRLEFPGGDAQVSWIDARDIAAVAARTLADDSLDGSVHELSGPQALTLAQTADVIGDALGHRVDYVDESIDDAVVAMSGFDRQQAGETFARLQAGHFAGVTDVVREVTGRPATSLAEFLAEPPER